LRQKELMRIIQYSEWWWLDDLASVVDKGKNFSFCHIQAGLGVQSAFIHWVLEYLSLG
jgi:hypothetical protein